MRTRKRRPVEARQVYDASSRAGSASISWPEEEATEERQREREREDPEEEGARVSVQRELER